MQAEPSVQDRDPQPYAGIRVAVTMPAMPAAIDAAFPELFGWLEATGTTMTGAPFIRYHVIDMAAELDIELAVPVPGPVEPSGRIQPGVLPGGRYVVLLHTGPYDGLVAANGALQAWAAEQGITLDHSADERTWPGRLERYLTDPSAEPDSAKWETEIAYLVAP